MICTKVRDGAKRIVRLKEGEPQGRHVVIVDDLVQSGGTLIECHALLSSLGAKHGEGGCGRVGGCVRVWGGGVHARGLCAFELGSCARRLRYDVTIERAGAPGAASSKGR